MASPTPSPHASLTELPPELRNNIYHLVAEEIDEVIVIGRKINASLTATYGIGPYTSQKNLWRATAKHPLSQTCHQLRLEFDTVHYHRAFKEISRLTLDLENLDLNGVSKFGIVLSRIPSLAQRLQAPGSLTFRFQLNKHALDSVKKLRAKDSLSECYEELPMPPPLTDEVVQLNFRSTMSLSAAQKKSALTLRQAAAVASELWLLRSDTEARESADLGLRPSLEHDFQVASWLWCAHFAAQHNHRQIAKRR